MKKLCFLILCSVFVLSTVLEVSTQGLPDAVTWEHLKKSTSTSISGVAGNCQRWINEARSNCKASIDQATQLITQKKDNAAVQSLIIQETIEETTSILQSVSSNVHSQLAEVGSRFQKRLEQVINSNNSLEPEILNELKTILLSSADQSDQMLTSIQQLFSSSYNPSTKLKEVCANGIAKLAASIDLELDQLQKVIIFTLNCFDKGVATTKDVQSMLKKSGQLPQNWASDSLKNILSTCTQITSTLQLIERTQGQGNLQTTSKEGKPQELKSKVMSVRQAVNDELSLLEEEIELDDGDNESGCGQIFEKSKKKIRTKLMATVKEIKKATDAKSIDSYTSNVLEDYGELLGDTTHKINGKIIDFFHQFIKLFKSVLDIMETINKDMNEKMGEIFIDQNTDTSDFYYNNIRKYFADTYLTDAKMHDLYNVVANCMRTSKSRKSLRKQIVKQLSTVTSDLVRDMDTMKSTTIYILLEIRKGVSALQNLKNKSNVSGIRYWFNFYDGKTDLAQVKKIIYIINAIDITGIFEREIAILQSPAILSKCETITETIQETLSKRTSDFLVELDQKTSLNEAELIRSTFLQTFNSVITIYKLKIKRVMKQTVVSFINVYEETLITLKRKNIKGVNFLDAVLDNETRNIDSDIPIFALYLAKNMETNVEQDTGVNLRRKFKNVGEAKYTVKSGINEINQVISNHIDEMKTGIQRTMTIVAQESQNLQQLQKDVGNNGNCAVDVNRFVNLEYLMKLANTLKISHGDITNGLTADIDSSNQQLECYLDSAVEQLRTEKQNALIEIEKCSNVKQLQIQVTTATTRLRGIISDTVMEIRSDITRYTIQFKVALNTYIKCTNHETLTKALERGRNNNSIKILLSQNLQTYLKDKYSQTVLENFLASADKNKNIQKGKALVIETLSLTVKQIENDMSTTKSEAMNTIFSTFKQAIDALESVNMSETKQRLDDEKIQKLTLLSRLLKILQDTTAIDAQDSIDQARSAINVAREVSNAEYKRSIKVLSSVTDAIAIEAEMKNTVNLFESTYNTMRQQIKSKVEPLSVDHYEQFKIANAPTLKTKRLLQEIMGGIYNKEFIKKEEYQRFALFINSESYTSSLAISSIYEKLQSNQSTNTANKQCLHVLDSLNQEISYNINNMEEIVNYISNIHEESKKIIISINKGKELEITDKTEISILTQSLLISQTLLQVQKRADFSGVQKTIHHEYGEAMQTIMRTTDENIVRETIAQSIEKYDTVTNILEGEVTQKFMKISADFTNKYETAVQVVVAERNEELLAILQDIVEQKACDIVSEKYRKFESYINSCNFRSRTFARDSYQNLIGQQEKPSITKDESLEHLKILTYKVEEYVQELDIESQFANENFLRGANVLESVQNGNFKLVKEQIQVITECVMISQMIFKQNFSSILSKNDDEWEAISTAKRSIDEEYDYAMEAIKSTKEKVIIEQTIFTSIYKYDDVYNNLREEMKQTFSTLQMDFISTYDTIIEILQIQNVPMYERLQKIQNYPTNISTKYTKFESFIKSETFTSYSLIRYELLKQKQAKSSNTIDMYAEQLTTLTKMTNKQIDEINSVQRYVTEVLHRSIEILQNTETDVNIQLNEEQFTTLCEAFRISKIIAAVISSKEQMDEMFLLAERSINDIYESAVNEIQTSTYNETSCVVNSIQNFTAIYDNLRVNVQEMFIHKSRFFTSTFTAVSKSVLLQNNELSSAFHEIGRKNMNAEQSSKEYQQLATYINSDKFSSSSYISYMYQNIRMHETSSTKSTKETRVEQITNLTNNVKEIITEMNQIHQLVLSYFNENTEYLKSIENNMNMKLTQEQIVKLMECVNVSEIIHFTCVSISEEKEMIFRTTEVRISEEFEKTINLINQAKEVSEMIQIMDTNIEHYEETYNTLKKTVKETLIQTSSEFSTYYLKSLEYARSQEVIQLSTFLEDLQTTRKVTTLIESYRKCEVYLNSESFKSISWVSQYFHKSSQQQAENVTREGCIEELQIITSEVNHQITQARHTSKYIVQLFEQSVEIFKFLESSSVNQELTQEQKQLLIESMILSEQISCKFSTKSQKEETLYTTAQTIIKTTYKATITTIKNTREVQVVRQTLLESARSYNNAFNSYREEVKNTFMQTMTEFSQHFDTITKKIIKQNGNVQIQTILHNIKSKKTSKQISEKYVKFESYIISEKFVSINIIKRFYSKIETQVQVNDKKTDSGLNQLRSLTEEADHLIEELNEICQYVSETIQISSLILKSIESNTNIKLTQEQITILTESILISEIISIETSSVTQREEKILIKAENRIEEEQNDAINTIMSSNDEEVVRSTITTTMKNYDETYNQAKEEVKESFTRTTTEFSQSYTKIIETLKTQGKTQTQNVLENIQKKKVNVEISQKYKNFETYLYSESFTTILLATHSYRNITRQSASKDLVEDSVRDVERIATEIQYQLNEMNTIQKYTSQTLQKSMRVLKNLENGENNIELTQEEMTILTESIMISETIHTEFNSIEMEKEKIFTSAEKKIDQEFDSAVNKIKTAKDEETIKQTMQESIETYDTTVHSIQEEVKHTFTETTTKFVSVFTKILYSTTSHTNEAVRNVLKDIKDHKVEVEVSKEYIVFEEFIRSETFSSFSITESYSEIQNEEKVGTETSVSDKCVNQLEKLTTKVNKYITQTHIVRKYVTHIIEKSTKILKIVEQEENIELTKEQTSVLNESMMISEKLSSQSNIAVSTEEVITKECETAVQSIETMNTKEEVEEVIHKNIQTYSKVYNNIEKKTISTLTQTSTNFSEKFDSLMHTSENMNSQISKEIKSSKEMLHQDQELQQFKSFIEDKCSHSEDTVDEMYKNISGSNKNEEDFRKGGIKVIKDLSTEVNNKITEMEKYQKYATETIAKGQAILQSIPDNKSISLNKEQIMTVTKTAEIIETISKSLTIKKEQNQTREAKTEKEMAQNENKNKSETSKTTKNTNLNQNVDQEQGDTETQQYSTSINKGEKKEVIKVQGECEENKKQEIIKQKFEKEESAGLKTQNIVEVQNIVKKEHDATVELLKSTENEEKVQEVLKEHIEVLDKAYCSAQESTRTELAQTSSSYMNNFQTAVKELENTEVCKTLNKVINEDTTEEEDEELNNFILNIKRKDFLKDSVEKNINKENITALNTKEKSIQEVDCMDKIVSDNLKNIEETSKFVSESLQKSDAILQKAKTEKDVPLDVEEIKQIKRSAKITRALQESETIISANESTTTSNGHVRKVTESSNVEKEKNIEQSMEHDFVVYQSSGGEEIENAGREVNENKRLEKKKDHTDSTFVQMADQTQSKHEELKEQNVTKYKEENYKTESVTTTKEVQTQGSNKEVKKLDKNEKLAQKEKGPLAPVEGVKNCENKYEKQSTLQNDDYTADLTAVQHNIEEENNAIIDSIKQTKNEEQVEGIVKEHIQTLDKTYENARHDTEKRITHISDEFITNFQSTLSNAQDTEIHNTLNGILSDSSSIQEDKELEKFASQINSETFSSTFSVANEFESNQEKETNTNMKEKSVQEIEAIGTKINKNLHTMEETTKFVSENLERSSEILRKVETNTDVRLNAEEIDQIAKSMKITKVLHESETMNSNSQTMSTRSLNTPENDDIATKSSRIEETHTNTRTEEEIHKQATSKTTKSNSKSFNDLAKDNCLSVEPQKCYEDKSKVLEEVSTSKLLVNWDVMESEDKCWPMECRNLSWSSNKFLDSAENKIFVEEISQILKISRNLIENTINIELKKLKLNRKVREDLSAMTVCVDNIYNILQRLSTYVSEEMERFSNTVEAQLKTTHIQEKLKTVSSTLDDEFMEVGKAFFDLQYSKSSDMLDLIDKKYENEICDTISKSRKVAMEKLQNLQSTTNTVLDNIDCLVLTMVDSFVSAEVTIQNLAKGGQNMSLEDLKNSQRLFEVLET